MKQLLKRFDISIRQYNTLSLLVFHSFFSAIFVSIFFSVANIEFIKNYGKESLPIGYLLSGIVGYLAINGYGRLLRKNGKRAFVGALLFMLIIAVILRSAYFFTTPNSEGTKYLSLILYLFATPFIYISSIQQSGLLLKIYNIQEGKKFTGIISSGGTLAYIVGYLSVPTCILFLKSNQNLLFIAIVGILFAIYFIIKINRTLIIDSPHAINLNSNNEAHDISLRKLLSQKFIRYIAICGGISTIAYYFIDYSFLINVQENVKTGEIDLTSFMGFFLTAVKIAELVLGLSSARFFRNFGLKAGMIILPMLCLFFIICIILLKWIPAKDLFLLSIIIWSMKFFERIFKKSIEEPTYKNLYQIFNTNERLAILNKIEGGTKQLSVIIGSIILLLFGRFVISENLDSWLLYISLPLFAFWVYSAYQLINAYKERLRDELKAKHVKKDDYIKSIWDKFSILFNSQSSLIETKSNALSILGIKSNLAKSNLESSLNIGSEKNSSQDFHFEEPFLIIPPKTQTPIVPKNSIHNNLNEKDLLLLALSIEQPSIITLKILDRKLREVQGNHEKKLILNILERSDDPFAISILLNHLNYPDYYIKKQVFKVLEIKKFKYSANEEIYFWNAIETTLSELTYIISILNSIPPKDDFSDLIKALVEEKHIFENRLLSILTWKYDNAAIKVIRENIFNDYIISNQEDNILALELMDNLLDIEIKEKIMTAFNTSNYARRLASLNKWYYYPAMNLKDALVSILNYDYTKIGIWVKASALTVINIHNSESYKKIVAGFNYHPNSLLRLLAHNYNTLVHGEPLPFLKGKEELMAITKLKKGKSKIDGEELYNLVKVLKDISIFNKTATNDLIDLCLSAEAKNNSEPVENTYTEYHKNNPTLIINGKITVEFSPECSLNILSKNHLSPNMFGDKKISKITLIPPSTIYELSPVNLANLIISSDSTLNSLVYADTRELN